MAVTTTKFIQYSVLPGIWPRIRDLFGSGFGVLAGILAVVYFNLGLLPAGHSYLNRQNSGRFGIRHVVAAAGKNLNFSWKHLDQIILYFTILIGLTILAVQLVLVCTSVFFYAPAFAFTSFLSSFGLPPSFTYTPVLPRPTKCSGRTSAPMSLPCSPLCLVIASSVLSSSFFGG